MMEKYRCFTMRFIRMAVIVTVILFYGDRIQLKLVNAQLATNQQEAEQAREQLEQLKTGIEELTADLQEESGQGTAVSDEAASGGLYADGIYEGAAQGFGGPVSVEVTVENGSITAVEVTEASGEDGAYLDMAKAVTDTIVDSQSADVDTVSGATFSSTGIIEAAAQALEGAVK